MMHIAVEMASSVFTTNTSRQWRILIVQSILDTSSSSALICGKGCVNDCLVGPHVSPHQLTGNHCREFLLHDLSKLLEDVPVAVNEYECGTCMVELWHILAALGEMFSITLVTTDERVQEDPLYGFHSQQI
jgi:hypothetical protein